MVRPFLCLLPGNGYSYEFRYSFALLSSNLRM